MTTCACGALSLSTTVNESHDRGLHSAAGCMFTPPIPPQLREEWRSIVTVLDSETPGHSVHNHSSRADAEHFKEWREAAGRGERHDGYIWCPVQITIYRRFVTDWEPLDDKDTK